MELQVNTETSSRLAARRALLAQPTGTEREPEFDKDALLAAGGV